MSRLKLALRRPIHGPPFEWSKHFLQFFLSLRILKLRKIKLAPLALNEAVLPIKSTSNVRSINIRFIAALISLLDTPLHHKPASPLPPGIRVREADIKDYNNISLKFTLSFLSFCVYAVALPFWLQKTYRHVVCAYTLNAA